MRELVLNHASLKSAGEHESLAWLEDLAKGVTALVGAGVTRKALRMQRWPQAMDWLDGRSLHDAYLLLLKGGGRARESAAYLLGLSAKAPLLSGVASEVRDRFLRCEEKTLPGVDGEPLVLCALTDAIAVGFPSEPVWDRDRLCIVFLELLRDGTFEDAQEDIDNLTRSAHAGRIIERHRGRLRRQCLDSADLWTRRKQVFSHLTFGPDVEDHLAKLNPGLLSTLVNRLAELNETAAAWVAVGGDAPPWKCRVSPESRRLRDYKKGKLLEARRFRAASGERVVFEWHARFGSGARIHLRFDARVRKIEIGYVGDHLPVPPPP